MSVNYLKPGDLRKTKMTVVYNLASPKNSTLLMFVLFTSYKSGRNIRIFLVSLFCMHFQAVHMVYAFNKGRMHNKNNMKMVGLQICSRNMGK